MGLYDFKPMFVPKILAGEKCHTIRAVRKVPQKVGKPMYLYTGLRRKGAKRIAVVTCVKIEQIRISSWGVVIDDIALTVDECEQLARRDGFLSFQEMMKFWNGRLPFRGHIIHWK